MAPTFAKGSIRLLDKVSFGFPGCAKWEPDVPGTEMIKCFQHSVYALLTAVLILSLSCFFSVIHNIPAAAPQPRGDEDGPGIGGPTPDGQPELGAEPT